MAADSCKYDNVLLGILQNEGQIANFLEVIFGFLSRRTDFYRVMKRPGESMGFPAGVAGKIAYSAFKKFEDSAEKDNYDKKTPKKVLPASVPPVVEIEEKLSVNLEDKKPVVPAVETKSLSDRFVETSSEVNVKESDKSQENVYVSNPECYNGATRDNYSWSQSISDVDVRVKVPKHICKGKQVKVDISKKHLKVCIENDSKQEEVLMDDDIMWDVHREECMWSLVPGEHIHINLEKIQERWWESLLQNEEKINVRKIDASRPMSDLDDEAQAKIGEMMYNEEQKRLGLPQSHEKNVQDILKKAWDVDGSPFKGTPYDPSKVQISSNTGSLPG